MMHKVTKLTGTARAGNVNQIRSLQFLTENHKRRAAGPDVSLAEDGSGRQNLFAGGHGGAGKDYSSAATASSGAAVNVGVSTSDETQAAVSTDGKRFNHTSAQVAAQSLPASSVTSWISDLVSRAGRADLSDTTVHRSKRMLLDTLGVGVLGAGTDISHTIARTCLTLEEGGAPGGGATTRGGARRGGAVLWGSRSGRASPGTAAYINGVSVHSMDMDDTWHPATHPSGPTLPAVLALAETVARGASLEDVLVAYNVGIQVQGLLLRSAQSARCIPSRFHPPAVVGVMGSAAACANLLGFGPVKSRAALGIAASFSGAPMANAGTTTKPLHAGKAARFGLEAALLADQGIEGNINILDMASGFGAFYDDFDPEALLEEMTGQTEFVLHSQDIALKRYPAHLGMHWTIDAALAVRDGLVNAFNGPIDVANISKLVIRAPPSRYINRPLPTSEHEARHSFQFNASTAILDGRVTPTSYHDNARLRPELLDLLHKVEIETPEDNHANFNEMYVELSAYLQDGTVVSGRCDTPYGHWRYPLTDVDVAAKFDQNTQVLPRQHRQEIVGLVRDMSSATAATDLTQLLHAY